MFDWMIAETVVVGSKIGWPEAAVLIAGALILGWIVTTMIKADPEE